MLLFSADDVTFWALVFFYPGYFVRFADFNV